MNRERWAEPKEAQTARVEAGTAARREEATRAVQVADAEIDRDGAELGSIGPEALAVMSSVEGNLAAAREGADRLFEKRASDQAARARSSRTCATTR